MMKSDVMVGNAKSCVSTSAGFKNLSAVLAMLALLSWQQTAGAQAGSDHLKLSAEQFDHLGIQIAPLQLSRHIPLLYAPARVILPPGQEVVVTTGQAGLIERLNVSVGDRVRKGQVLATLLSPALVSLQTQYLRLSSENQLANQNWQRDRKLLKDGIIPERRLQETQTVLSGKNSELNEIKQLLVMAGMSVDEVAELEKTHRLSQKLTLRAPIDGVVLDSMATTGERLDTLAPLFHIGNLQNLWLEIHVPQEHLAQIKIGDQVSLENSAVTARVSLLGQHVNPQNQTVLVRATINGHPNELRVGQSVSCKVTQASDATLFSVPNTALIQSEGQSYVFVRTVEGFEIHKVAVIGKQEQESVISGDLNPAEQIAVKGAAALKAQWLGIGGGE